ncbi:putative Cyclic nucleotide-gated ion channel [Quillaja saponaria]|uniref:Cyclic nucleotide-gated ion channel n=1 Tax=Quillaja saponaria TaxID=32244 RepID=A0AAD7VGC5_QUISA|nr:putative Cyclic nucleotide-gated ion channel [Quillaja saponaria]
MPSPIQRWNNGSQSKEEDDPISSPIECYACTQARVPVFHSNRCDPSHQPYWESTAGSSLIPIQGPPDPRNPSPSTNNNNSYNSLSNFRRFYNRFRGILDPRSKHVRRWNRAVLLARGMALVVDPLFFYVVTLSGSGSPCFYMDYMLAVIFTVARTCVDLVHLFHLLLQFRLAYVSSESLVVGCGKLVWDARAVASHNLRSLRGFWFDAFVILPYSSGCDLLQKVTGFIFGSVWWRFNLNILGYLIASHVAGGFWYALSTQRLASCLQLQCDRSKNCTLSLFCSRTCHPSELSGFGDKICGANLTKLKSYCLDDDGPFEYGIYGNALPIFASNSLADRILYPVFWGLINLSSFGNELEPSSDWMELIFSICITTAGLVIFVTLIGNIQIFLHTIMSNKKKMQLQYRDMEWWMKRRQLPYHLRERVRNYERQRLATMEGIDEIELIQHLPDGLRRDIKRYLCLDLIKKVPLFGMLDDLILDNICDLVRPLIYSKGEKILREGDPVQRTVFMVHGRVKRSQGLSRGFIATSMLEPGCFFGDELLSWCLRRPFIDRLPASSATFSCVQSIEAYGLEAHDLRYITDHFRYKFARVSLRRTLRYYSSNWRTWGAVVIQIRWRRYIYKKRRSKGLILVPNEGTQADQRLRQFAAMFMSIKPHDHLQ